MKTLTSYWRGIVIIVASTVVDVSIRFATSFHLNTVLCTEAVIFTSAGALPLLASHKDGQISFALQRFDLWSYVTKKSVFKQFLPLRVGVRPQWIYRRYGFATFGKIAGG